MTLDVERLFLDTEFIEDGHTIELLSIAVVSEDGQEFYAENLDADLTRANEWVKANVIPHLDLDRHGIHLHEIGEALRYWVGATETHLPEFWAYYGDYDWVVTCQLFGRMIDLPPHWPMFCMDVKQLCVSLGDPPLPPQSTTEHHALADARWTLEAYRFLTGDPGSAAS